MSMLSPVRSPNPRLSPLVPNNMFTAADVFLAVENVETHRESSNVVQVH